MYTVLPDVVALKVTVEVLLVNVPLCESQLPETLIFELPEQVTVPLAPIVISVVVQPLLLEAPIVTVAVPPTPVTVELPVTAKS